MGAGASASVGTEPHVIESKLALAINKVSKLKPSVKLDGEACEDMIGFSLFDPNAFAVLAEPDERDSGVYKVPRGQLLKVLQVHQILHSAANARVPKVDQRELNRLEDIQRKRKLALAAPRQHADTAVTRGAIYTHPSDAVMTFTPPMPASADSRTKMYPYAAASVAIVQRSAAGGWELAIFRNSVTGEFGLPTGGFADRHGVAANRHDALRFAAAEAMSEQSCGLVRCAPGRAPKVLRDAASVSVTWDGGAHLDGDDAPRVLHQIFIVHVENLSDDDLSNNLQCVETNMATNIMDATPGPAKPWLETDQLTFVPLAALARLGRQGQAVADHQGRVCPCRKLADLVGRPVVPAPTTTLPEDMARILGEAEAERASKEGGGGGSFKKRPPPSVLAELSRKLGLLLGDESGDNGGGAASPSSGPLDGVVQDPRWFGPEPTAEVGADRQKGEQAETVEIEIGRQPVSNGGLLAGCLVASLTTFSTRVTRSSHW